MTSTFWLGVLVGGGAVLFVLGVLFLLYCLFTVGGRPYGAQNVSNEVSREAARRQRLQDEKRVAGVSGPQAAAAIAFLLLALAAVVHGQTATDTLAWDIERQPAEVASYTWTVTIDGTARAEAVTCGPKTGQTSIAFCSITMPALAVTLHTYVIEAINASVGASTAGTFDLSKAPATATRTKITRKTTQVLVPGP